LVIESFVKRGYSEREASKFANDGCWEVQIPGKTYFMYMPFDSLNILQHKTLNNYADDVNFLNFEELYSKYIEHLRFR
jgi:hypothetical protein